MNMNVYSTRKRNVRRYIFFLISYLKKVYEMKSNQMSQRFTVCTSACHQLAEFYMSVEKNVSKAKDIYKMACDELGVMESCFALGNLHLTQKGKDASSIQNVNI